MRKRILLSLFLLVQCTFSSVVQRRSSSFLQRRSGIPNNVYQNSRQSRSPGILSGITNLKNNIFDFLTKGLSGGGRPNSNSHKKVPPPPPSQVPSHHPSHSLFQSSVPAPLPPPSHNLDGGSSFNFGVDPFHPEPSPFLSIQSPFESSNAFSPDPPSFSSQPFNFPSPPAPTSFSGSLHNPHTGVHSSTSSLHRPVSSVTSTGHTSFSSVPGTGHSSFSSVTGTGHTSISSVPASGHISTGSVPGTAHPHVNVGSGSSYVIPEAVQHFGAPVFIDPHKGQEPVQDVDLPAGSFIDLTGGGGGGGHSHKHTLSSSQKEVVAQNLNINLESHLRDGLWREDIGGKDIGAAKNLKTHSKKDGLIRREFNVINSEPLTRTLPQTSSKPARTLPRTSSKPLRAVPLSSSNLARTLPPTNSSPADSVRVLPNFRFVPPDFTTF